MRYSRHDMNGRLGSLFAFNEAVWRGLGILPGGRAMTFPRQRFVHLSARTVRVRMAELGARALERLAARIEAPDRRPHRPRRARLAGCTVILRGLAESPPPADSHTLSAAG